MKKSALYRYVFGFDFFISYSRADGINYGLNVANILFEAGYTAYIDQLGSEPNKRIPESLLRIVSNAKVLIIICSDGSINSTAMEKEIALFKGTKRSIIPISFDAKNNMSIWKDHILGLAHSIDSKKNLQEGKIDEKIITRIIQSFTYKRQRTRINRIITGLIVLFFILPTVIIYSSLKVNTLQENISIKNKALIDTEKNLFILKKRSDSVKKSLSLNQKALASTTDSLKVRETQLQNTNKEGSSIYQYANGINDYLNLLTKYISQIGETYQKPEFSSEFLQGRTPYRIFFSEESSVLSTSNYRQLDELADFYKKCEQCKGIPLEISGFVSSLNIAPGDISFQSKWGKLNNFSYFAGGTLAHSLLLGKDCANTVKTYLVNMGIDAKMIKVKSYGNAPADFPFITHADIKIKSQ